MGSNSSVQLPTSKEQWLESMAERLTCSVCIEIYTDPVTLPCGHTLCKECINQWSSANQQSQWICPLCKREDAVVRVEQLDVNFTLKNLCQEYKDYCQNSVHSTSSTEAVAIEEISKAEFSEFCEHHPTELVRYICMTCKENFCGICSALERKHMDLSHQVYTYKDAVEPVSEIYDQIKNRVIPLFGEIQEKNETLTDVLTDLSATEEAIKKHCDELKNKLCRLVDSQMSILLQPINNHEVSNGICLGQLQQLNDDALMLQASLEPQVTEQNVISKVNELLPLLHGVEQLEQSVELHCSATVQATPQFEQKNDLNDNMVLLVRESCGTVEEQGIKITGSTSSDQNTLADTAQKTFHYSHEEFPTIDNHESPDGPSSCAVFSGLAIVTNVNTQEDHIQSVTEWETVDAKEMCSFPVPSSSSKFGHVAWIGNYILVPDMEGGCIRSVNYNSGDMVILFKYDSRYRPFAISACTKGDTLILAVNVMYKRKWKNVILHETDSEILSTPDPLSYKWDRFHALLGLGYKPVSLIGEFMSYFTPGGNIGLYSLDADEVVEDNNDSNWIQAHLGAVRDDCTLYAVDVDSDLFSYDVEGAALCGRVYYETSNIRSISCLKADKTGCLWVLDKVGKKLVQFYSDGTEKCNLSTRVPWISEIHSIHLSHRNIFLLTQVDEELFVIRIPLPGDGSYKLSRLSGVQVEPF